MHGLLSGPIRRGGVYILIPVGLTAPEIDEKTVAVHALNDVGLDFGIIVICATI